MKIKILNYEQYLDRIGGGFTFLRNFTSNFDVCDNGKVLFIPNPMQANVDEVREITIPRILRLDNIPEEKNNRGCSASKLKAILPLADYIIFQSEWSKSKYLEFCELNDVKITDNQKVIYNGVDTRIFHKPNNEIELPHFIYVHGKGDNKRWPEAQEFFRRMYYSNRDAKLFLIGSFARETSDYNFGFYNGENFQYFGPQNDKSIADIMRMCKYILYPAFADSCPNTLIEAMSCGLEVFLINGYGGQKEVYDLFQESPKIFILDYMINEYKKVFKEF